MHRFSYDGPFSLDLTVSCGQAFRWRKEENGWSAPFSSGIWHVRQKDSVLYYDGCSEDELVTYFALDLDLDDILASIDVDPLIHEAVTACRGLRICRQPAFECLISYLCASCSNIPMIAKRIELLAETFGKKLDDDRCAFPSAKALAKADTETIRSCKTGYRDTYIADTASFVAKHPAWLKTLHDSSYDDAKHLLMERKGIGDKVADCVLLFGCEKYEAVPVDVWIERILRTQYFPDRETKLPYKTASSFAQKHFGTYAGYAQEYLYAEREIITKRGL
ncbi:MAG TPA: DNA glycosylase [Methanocorpusculum sp.]|nr:DNA glycosylase [Methanocorpusculum sp.]